MQRTVLRLIAGLTLSTVGLSGCGGGGDARLSKATFIARGEKLCNALKTRLDPLFDDFVATLPKKAAAYRQAVPLGRTFSKEFAALRPPKSDETTIQASLKEYDAGLDRL